MGLSPAAPAAPRGGRSVLALDIGGTKIVGGVVDAEGAVTGRFRTAAPVGDPSLLEERVVRAFHAAGGRTRVDVVGISLAGFVSNDRSTVRMAPNLQMVDHPLGKRLARVLGLPVVVENDVNAAAWGEYRHGHGRGASLMLMVSLGTGLGGGVVANGDLIRGTDGFAAEIGHLPYVPEGHPCGCGLRGCWEQYASGSALARSVNDQLAAGAPSSLRSLGRPAVGAEIQQAAEEGDPLATSAFAELGRHLGRGLAGMVSLLDPEVIVLGGGVAAAATYFREACDTSLAAASAANRASGTARAVRVSDLGADGALVGVADLARDRSASTSGGPQAAGRDGPALALSPRSWRARARRERVRQGLED